MSSRRNDFVKSGHQEGKRLSQPLLYLSLFFKRHREDYYRMFGRVWTDGKWEGWTAFFLEDAARCSSIRV
jgi:hypothetical protein